MKLDPVFLAPEPKKPGRSPSVLLAAASLVVLASGISGWLIGYTTASPSSDVPASVSLGSKDADVKWALEKASGPIEDLIEYHALFLIVALARASDEPELWSGVERLATAVIESNGELPQERRKVIAGTLVRGVALYDHPPRIERVVPQLEELLR